MNLPLFFMILSLLNSFGSPCHFNEIGMMPNYMMNQMSGFFVEPAQTEVVYEPLPVLVQTEAPYYELTTEWQVSIPRTAIGHPEKIVTITNAEPGLVDAQLTVNGMQATATDDLGVDRSKPPEQFWQTELVNEYISNDNVQTRAESQEFVYTFDVSNDCSSDFDFNIKLVTTHAKDATENLEGRTRAYAVGFSQRCMGVDEGVEKPPITPAPEPEPGPGPV